MLYFILCSMRCERCETASLEYAIELQFINLECLSLVDQPRGSHSTTDMVDLCNVCMLKVCWMDPVFGFRATLRS